MRQNNYSGTKLAGYTSADGVSWTQIGFSDIPLADVQVGLWAAGADGSVMRFENVTLGPVAEEPVEPRPGGALPEPWQSVTFGEGTGNSAYTDETDTFNLSAEGVGNTPTTHFVYQSAENDATIVARVQNLETIDQTGSAGLMIRQDTSPESAHAYLALCPQGIHFESWQGGHTEIARVEGSSASVPAWLKLERKGEVFMPMNLMTG